MVFAILLFPSCVAAAEGIAQGLLFPGGYCALTWFRAVLVGKNKGSQLELPAPKGSGGPQQNLDQPEAPGSSPGGDCARLEEELEEREAVFLPEE